MNIKTNNTEKSEMAITALYEVMDPEIDLNIIDLGLVYEIDFKDDSNDIIVTFQPPWDQSMISEAGNLFLSS